MELRMRSGAMLYRCRIDIGTAGAIEDQKIQPGSGGTRSGARPSKRLMPPT